MATQQPLQPTVMGGIFRLTKSIWSDGDANGDRQRSFTLRAKNLSGEWIDVVVDRSMGNASTGHIEKGASSGFTEPLDIYFGRTIKITRWRPGMFGVAGNGGGQITFTVPTSAFDVIVEMDVTG